MNIHNRFRRLAAIACLIAGVSIATFQTHAQKGGDFQPSAQSSGGAALGTGLISLAPGQSIRLSAVNVGGKDITLNFIFVTVSEQGKLAGLIICPEVVASPGDAAIDEFKYPGGTNVVQFYVQVRVRDDARDVEKLVPSLQIVNEETGRMEHVLSGADFAAFRPIWVPT